MRFTLHNAFSFSGRVTRFEFWGHHLFWSAMIVGPLLIAYWLPHTRAFGDPIGIFVILAMLIAYPAIASVHARRLHDIGHSGWWVLFLFVPFVNIALWVYLGFFRGNPESNKYGPPGGWAKGGT